MKLVRMHIHSAPGCGGLLDGLKLQFRQMLAGPSRLPFAPLCLIGANGAGKSQFLQVVAEVFQSLIHAVAADEERNDGNPGNLFEIEYLIQRGKSEPAWVRASRGAKKGIKMEVFNGEDWLVCDLTEKETRQLLPCKVVGYTSGANETLSLPFILSRSGYAADVAKQAIETPTSDVSISDPALMAIDYGTHLEVLVANLLLSEAAQRKALLVDAKLGDLNTFRCVVQLGHAKAPTGGVKLTHELAGFITQLRRCSTCNSFDPDSKTHTFDFYVSDETRKAFKYFWSSALLLYSAFHKLAMLNDLAISRKIRKRFERETKQQKFATRLPEPQDEEKVFRFEEVTFSARTKGKVVDYVSLSDGEHQLAQLLGTMSMISFADVLFLLDEPESHFNPQWRVKFLSNLLQLPTAGGKRNKDSSAARQDCVLTTHSPFVPSDMPRDNVFVFSKDGNTSKVRVRHPNIETFGATFDGILSDCFDIAPPMSDVPKAMITTLLASQDPGAIERGMATLGDSVDKVMLADRLRRLIKLQGV